MRYIFTIFFCFLFSISNAQEATSFILQVNTYDGLGNIATTRAKVTVADEMIAFQHLTVEDGKIYIIDKEKNTYTVLKNKGNKKLAEVKRSPAIEEIEDKYEEYLPEEGLKITSTSEMKEIEGFTTIKVEVVGADFESDIWVTDGVEVNFMEVLGMLFLKNGEEVQDIFDISTHGVGGFPLLIKVENNQGRQKALLTVSDIADADLSVFDLSGYEVIQAPASK